MSGESDKNKKKAREMLLDGETNEKIKEETEVRPKAVGRIQKEITKHF